MLMSANKTQDKVSNTTATAVPEYWDPQPRERMIEAANRKLVHRMPRCSILVTPFLMCTKIVMLVIIQSGRRSVQCDKVRNGGFPLLELRHLLRHTTVSCLQFRRILALFMVHFHNASFRSHAEGRAYLGWLILFSVFVDQRSEKGVRIFG
jgi:hypothetical protein